MYVKCLLQSHAAEPVSIKIRKRLDIRNGVDIRSGPIHCACLCVYQLQMIKQRFCNINVFNTSFESIVIDAVRPHTYFVCVFVKFSN